MKEYRLLLSERLLALADYDVDREARCVSISHNVVRGKHLVGNGPTSLCAHVGVHFLPWRTTTTTRYLELLKLRFGEEHMTQCDVMLKDIADSKRITSRIREDLRDSPEVGTLSDCARPLR